MSDDKDYGERISRMEAILERVERRVARIEIGVVSMLVAGSVLFLQLQGVVPT